MAPVSMILSDLKARFQGHEIVSVKTRKRYKIEL